MYVVKILIHGIGKATATAKDEARVEVSGN